MTPHSCPSKLYKYLSYNGLERTLATQSLRLSRPIDFNDPIDMYLQDALGMDLDDFLEGMKLAFYDFISGEIDYSSLLNSPRSDMIILMHKALKSAKPAQREYIKEQILSTPIQEIYDIAAIRSVTVEALSLMNELLQTTGVFCATTSYNNLLMWAHYADQHRGALVGLTPCVEKDSPLLASKEVQYTDVRPVLYKVPIDMVIYGSTLTGQEVAAKVIDSLVYTKSAEWAYEKEYRLAIFKFIPKSESYRTIPFHSEELTSICLGCRMNRERKTEAIKLARTINPSVNLYEAAIAPREFRLEYIEKRDE